MLKLKPANLGKFNNANFCNFMSRISVLIQKSGGTAMGIEESVLLQFDTNLEAFGDLVNRSISSEYTAQLVALDVTRDRLYRYVRNELNICRYSSNEAVSGLADVIDVKLLNIYAGDITSAANSQESALIADFVTDVKACLTDEQIDLLGIGTELEELYEANRRYDELFVLRSQEKSKTVLGLSQTLRDALTSNYEQIGASAAYFASLSESADTDIQDKCQKSTFFLQSANAMIRDFRKNVETGEAVAAAFARRKSAGTTEAATPS
jgi:hypothetical protein